MSEEPAYGITKVLFERRADLVVIHSEAENLTLESAIVGSPISFHDGAVRYYREQQAWWDSRRWDELLFTSSGRVRSKGFPLALSHGTKPARELFQLAEAPVEHVVHLRDRDGRRSAPGRL